MAIHQLELLTEKRQKSLKKYFFITKNNFYFTSITKSKLGKCGVKSDKTQY